MTTRKAKARATTRTTTGVLHFVQDDDEKHAATTATTSATADPCGMTTRKSLRDDS
jgi:hypothetical protein